MENQIITFQDEQGNITVSSRSMALALSNYKDIADQFTNWIKVRVNRMVLELGKDYFITRDFKNVRGTNVTDFKLTLDSAIKLAKAEKFEELATYLSNIKGLASLHSPINEIVKESSAVHETLIEPVKIDIDGETREAFFITTTPNPIKTKSKAEQLLELAQSLAEEESKPQPSSSVSEDRIKAVEFKLNILLDHIWGLHNVLFGSSITDAIAYDGTSDPDEIKDQIDATKPLPEITVLEGEGPIDPTTTRGKLHQIVNSFAASEKKSHRSVWTWLYKQLNRYYGFNVALQRQTKHESYLDAADRGGQIETLYYIAQKTLIPAKEAEPAQATASQATA